MRKASSPAFALLCLSTAATPACADLVISGDATQNVNCVKNTCSATAQDAVLNAGEVENRLAASELKILSGHVAHDITVTAPLSWTSNSRLTLIAYRSVKIDRAVSVAGSGALALKTNNGGLLGELSFGRRGKIGFLGTANEVAINGHQYVLVSSIAGLESAISIDPAGYYALANDYDASIDGIYNSAPIPEFAGTLEGFGNTISGITIGDTAEKAKVGLFAKLSIAWIRNLNLRKVRIFAPLGGLVGTLAGLSAGGRIERVTSSGIVIAGDKSAAGGLVGFSQDAFLHHQYFYSHISHCEAAGQITGGEKAYLGGLVGISYGVVDFSSASASVTGGKRAIVGGLAGLPTRNIIGSFATGDAFGGRGSIVGGLVGEDIADVSASYSLGKASTESDGVGRWTGWICSFIRRYNRRILFCRTGDGRWWEHFGRFHRRRSVHRQAFQFALGYRHQRNN